jgi:hypothetical protein
MLRQPIVLGFVVTLFVLACNKGPSLEQLRMDGYQCLKKGGGAGGVPKGKEHCFMCTDQDSMMKCTTNPLTSGCKEVPLAECKP